jgi:hypothetical protein
MHSASSRFTSSGSRDRGRRIRRCKRPERGEAVRRAVVGRRARGDNERRAPVAWTKARPTQDGFASSLCFTGNSC